MPQPHAEYAALRQFHPRSGRTHRPRSLASLLLSVGRLVVLAGLYTSLTALPSSATCASPRNPIEAENCLSGNPPSEWYVVGSGSPNIQGFTTDISVNVGQTVFFKVSTNAVLYSIDIYRLGFYQGNGARRITSISPSLPLPQLQPPCVADNATGLTDCGNWAISASWAVPATAASGVYFAKLVRTDTGEASPILFVVRNNSSHSDILVQTSDETWHAYNDFGGSSLYTGPTGRAYKVSYNRPFNVPNMYTWFFSAEYPMLRWLEANGYDVTYFTGVDADRNGKLITQHRVYMSVGHDEYWSGGQRASVEAARTAAVNLAFFSGNEIFWKTRWEPSIDGTGTPYRTLVCYKETLADRVIDPGDPPTWTGMWRDSRFSPPADGGRPENALSGTMYKVNEFRTDSITVPEVDGRMRFWRNTSIASLVRGQVATLPAGTLGYEWDVDEDNGFRPAGLIPLSTTTIAVPKYLLDNYTEAGGALVFGAGTVQWSWGLDANHAISGTPTDPNIQQATVNLLADMGVQPATLQGGLLPAAPSTDTAAPRSTITSPAPGTRVNAGSPLIISGAAVDHGGGVVGAVEVSLDGGKTWHPAVGRENWSYAGVFVNGGLVNVQSRAVDDSGNMEVPSTGISVAVTPQRCPCTIWPASAVPQNVDAGPNSPLELGVAFKSETNGYITGVRFYKSAGNTGTHVGNLWSASGALLGSAIFSGETTSGWQQVNFPTAVPVTANTVYVASYHSTIGHFSADWNYFARQGVDSAPLHAPANGAGSANGLYAFASGSVFPGNTYMSANFWVDVVFNTVRNPLSISTTSLPGGSESIPYNQTVTAAGGTPPYTWSVAAGALPAGLTLSSSGQISGAPRTVGSGSFTLQVADASVPRQTAVRALSIPTAQPPGTPGPNNFELNGNYALSFNGIYGSSGGSAVFAAVGRFTTDGAGNVTNGQLDTNGIGPGAVLTALAFTGSYAIGTDHRGLMTLNIGGGTAHLALAMMPDGNARFVKLDAAGGAGIVGSGTIEKVDTAAYSAKRIVGAYAFGVAGSDDSNIRTALIGQLTSNGSGVFTSGTADMNTSGAVSSMTLTTATYALSDSTNGRGTMSLPVLAGGVPQTLNFVFYVVNAGKLLAMETDAVTRATPLLNGVVLKQQSPDGGFSNASLNGNIVTYLTGLSTCGAGTIPAPYVLAGLLTADGNGALTLTEDQNCGGTPGFSIGLPWTYGVEGNGRTTIATGTSVALGYLVSSNQAFLLNTDSSVLFGFGEPQAAQSLNNSAVAGTYAAFTSAPATYGVVNFSGEFTADGVAPTGNIAGTKDVGASSGMITGASGSATYSVSSSPLNGRGTVTDGLGWSAAAYLASTTKFVAVPLSDPNPVVIIFEQAPPPPTLFALLLTPTSVVGGAQSPVGTVTLSGPAPAGGAAVLLSTDNNAATVPSTLIVPAGATSATFTVSTSVVPASASATISASYNGTTQTARVALGM
jgi:hypothetical protein